MQFYPTMTLTDETHRNLKPFNRFYESNKAESTKPTQKLNLHSDTLT